MIVQNKNIEKMCSFYVSEYHLEMILVPFINKKIEEKENVIINTEYNLEDSLEVLLSKMNLKKENKEKILNLGWNVDSDKEIKDKSNVIIIGNKNYIDDVNGKILQKDIDNVTIVDCYNIEEMKSDISNVVNNYDCNLNTTGFEKMKL